MAEMRWTDETQRWLQDIYEYIAADNPQAAARTIEGIYDRAQDTRRHRNGDAVPGFHVHGLWLPRCRMFYGPSSEHLSRVGDEVGSQSQECDEKHRPKSLFGEALSNPLPADHSGNRRQHGGAGQDAVIDSKEVRLVQRGRQRKR